MLPTLPLFAGPACGYEAVNLVGLHLERWLFGVPALFLTYTVTWVSYCPLLCLGVFF